MSLLKKASRKNIPLKIGLAGVSGSGKTYSALLLAKGILGSLKDVVVLDTENESACLYSHLGDYSTLNLAPPYAPDRYIRAIQYILKEAPETKLIIIDSASHEWDGEGGCLDIQSKLGGRWQDWAKVTPMHRKFIDTVLQTPIHFIVTMRKKSDYSVTVENNKTKIEKVGLKEVQRDGFEYDLSLSFNIDLNHYATASKDRTGMFPTDVPFLLDESVGEKIAAWNSGVEKTEV